jgi:hypothetical protein
MTTGDSPIVQTANTVCPIKSQLIHMLWDGRLPFPGDDAVANHRRGA